MHRRVLVLFETRPLIVKRWNGLLPVLRQYQPRGTDTHQFEPGGDQMDATTIAVDLAKDVFEGAIANGQWRVVRRYRLSRVRFERFLRDEPAAHVVMEACGSAHDGARTAGSFGHNVTLLPSQYVRPSVRRHKTDRPDAERR